MTRNELGCALDDIYAYNLINYYTSENKSFKDSFGEFSKEIAKRIDTDFIKESEIDIERDTYTESYEIMIQNIDEFAWDGICASFIECASKEVIDNE